MAQEEIQLLLKDLSARLMYGVMCQVDDGAAGLNDGKLIEIDISRELIRFDDDGYWDAYIDDVKPYLRPMSSMTEEEREELKQVALVDNEGVPGDIPAYIDWLNKKMFDYRGLIPMGLALEAPEGMYNIKEK